jgi:L-threonylcarbamoyladenylate synthase
VKPTRRTGIAGGTGHQAALKTPGRLSGTGSGRESENVVRLDPQNPAPDLIERAADILRRGGLVAFPTETVYGLGANALDAAAVRKIFAAKDRPQWDPLIVHVTGIEMARQLAAELPENFEPLARKFWPGPLTLVVRKAERVPPEVTAGLPTVALRQPRHPVAAALLAAAALPVAAPSANRFGRPSPTRAEHVLEDLGERVDLILDAGPTPVGVESTILDLTRTPPVILRPGGIGREQLGNATVAPAMADGHVLAPGMMRKHYAPRARVEVFETREQLLARAAQLRDRRVGLIEGEAEELARTLFAWLRELDRKGVEVILALLPPATGIGLAVRDRLRRAAGVSQ